MPNRGTQAGIATGATRPAGFDAVARLGDVQGRGMRRLRTGEAVCLTNRLVDVTCVVPRTPESLRKER